MEWLREAEGSVEPLIADSFQLLKSTSKSSFTDQLKRLHPATRGAVGRFLRKQVEAFASDFPTLSPAQRRERFEALEPAVAFDPFAKARLQQLEPLLNIADHADCNDESDPRWLSQRLLELAARPAPEQIADWNRLVRTLERMPKTTEAMAKSLLQSSPELKAAMFTKLSQLAGLSTYEERQSKHVAKYVRSNIGTLVGRETRSIARHVFKGSGQQTQKRETNWAWLLIVVGIGLTNAFRSCDRSDGLASRSSRPSKTPIEKFAEWDRQQEMIRKEGSIEWPLNLATVYSEKDPTKAAVYRLRFKDFLEELETVIDGWESILSRKGPNGLLLLEQRLKGQVDVYREASHELTSTPELRELHGKRAESQAALLEVFVLWRDQRIPKAATPVDPAKTEPPPAAGSDFQSFLDSLPNPNGSTNSEAIP